MAVLAAAVLSQDQALRAFLVGQEAQGMAWLETQALAGEPRTLDEARDPTPLAAGYHVVDLVGTEPPVRYIAVIPQAAAPKGGRPLIVAYSRGPNPPDELPVRAAYGGFLEAGWTLLVPTRPGSMGLTNEPTNPERNPWSTRGRQLMSRLVADLALRSPIDRERVSVLGRWTDRPAKLARPTWPTCYATPFAACWLVLPGGSSAPAPDDVGRWQGRSAVFHRSRHNPDTTALLNKRLTSLSPPVNVRTVIDPHLDWAGQVVLGRDVIARTANDLRRPAEPDLLEFHCGAPYAPGHEWISAPTAAGVRLVARREAGAIALSTPDAPASTLFHLKIWFASDPGGVRVTFNERPVFGGTVPHDARAALRCLRHQALTGRTARRVLILLP